jgi:hypothetical protein
MSNARSALAALAVVSALVVAGCDDPAALHDHAAPATSSAVPALPQQGALLQQVKSATGGFHSQARATRAGYAEASECVAVPGLGGMGFHWLNEDLVDPFFDPLQPEAVLYEPDAHGNEKLVGVEYIVIDVGQDAPTFDGQPFDVGGTPVPVDHWSLHVWVHKENPNGIFTPFNPDVSCP